MGRPAHTNRNESVVSRVPTTGDPFRGVSWSPVSYDHLSPRDHALIETMLPAWPEISGQSGPRSNLHIPRPGTEPAGPWLEPIHYDGPKWSPRARWAMALLVGPALLFEIVCASGIGVFLLVAGAVLGALASFTVMALLLCFLLRLARAVIGEPTRRKWVVF